jgi:hypothetical protein
MTVAVFNVVAFATLGAVKIINFHIFLSHHIRRPLATAVSAATNG